MQTTNPELRSLIYLQENMAMAYRLVTGENIIPDRDIEPESLSDEETEELSDAEYLEADNSYKSSRED